MMAASVTQAVAQARAAGWRIELWDHCDGVDVVATRATPDAPYVGAGDQRQLHSMELCRTALAALRQP